MVSSSFCPEFFCLSDMHGEMATRDRRGPRGASGRFADINPVRVGR